MKKNFTEQELNLINKAFGNIFNVRFNKAGNITLEYKIPCPHNIWAFNGTEKCQKFFTFYRPYFKDGEIIIRSISKNKDGKFLTCHPLNMKRTRVKTNWGEYLNYNINDSYFKNMGEAIEYFEKYLLKYQQHNIRKQLNIA